MCDYSLQNVKSRPASVGDKLTTHNFSTGTRGFKGADDTLGGSNATAVCVLPGTEIAFADKVKVLAGDAVKELPFNVAVFGQVDKAEQMRHHDVLVFADDSKVYLTSLAEGQEATILQLPAQPKNETEREEQRRAEFV